MAITQEDPEETSAKKTAPKPAADKEKPPVSENLDEAPDEAPPGVAPDPDTTPETKPETPPDETPPETPTEPANLPTPVTDPEPESDPTPPPEPPAIATTPLPTVEQVLATARGKFPRAYELDKFNGPRGQKPSTYLIKVAPPLWRDKGGIVVAGDIWAKLPEYVQERILKHVSIHMAGIVVVTLPSFGREKLNAQMSKFFEHGGAADLGKRVIGASSSTLLE